MYTLLVLFFAVSIVFSFLCSIWEAVLLSITPLYTEQRVQAGGTVGRTLGEFKADIDRPLSAILLLSEIVPKTIGANYWKELAGFTVRGLRLVMVPLAPLVWLSQLITGLLKREERASVLDRADFSAMAEIGAREGVFDEGESTVLRNLLRFESVLAEHVMTPRTVVVAADQTMTVRTFRETHPTLRFSRVPIYEGSPDHVSGYVLKDRMLEALVDGEDDITLGSLRRPITAIEESFPIPKLFEHFTTERDQIALVVDRFGGTAGIVTMEDVIETLIGTEIVDEKDGATDMQLMARRQWEVRARRLGLLEDLEDSIEGQASATSTVGDTG